MLLNFLCRVVDELTDGLEEHAGEGVDTPQIPKLEFKRSGHVEMWSKYINQPFAEPPFFDLDSLISTAKAMTNHFADHIWLLQTDAAYMCCTIRTLTSAIPPEPTMPGNDKQVHIKAFQELNADNGCYNSWN
jgi:hypothetical protein